MEPGPCFDALNALRRVKRSSRSAQSFDRLQEHFERHEFRRAGARRHRAGDEQAIEAADADQDRGAERVRDDLDRGASIERAEEPPPTA